MKLFNVITIQDIYVLAKDHDDAREAANNVIKNCDQKPYEQVAYEIGKERDIRAQWRDEVPWVSESLPDYNPDPVETCLEAFTRLYSKR